MATGIVTTARYSTKASSTPPGTLHRHPHHHQVLYTGILTTARYSTQASSPLPGTLHRHSHHRQVLYTGILTTTRYSTQAFSPPPGTLHRHSHHHQVLYTDIVSNETFDLQLFHHSNQPGPLTNGLKYLRFLLRLLKVKSYSNFSIRKTDYPQYDTAGSKKN